MGDPTLLQRRGTASPHAGSHTDRTSFIPALIQLRERLQNFRLLYKITLGGRHLLDISGLLLWNNNLAHPANSSLTQLLNAAPVLLGSSINLAAPQHVCENSSYLCEHFVDIHSTDNVRSSTPWGDIPLETHTSFRSYKQLAIEES